MATLASVLNDIATLSQNDINALKKHLAKIFVKHADSIETMVKDNRFAGGLVCPVCGCVHIVRNGHRKGSFVMPRKALRSLCCKQEWPIHCKSSNSWTYICKGSPYCI